MDLGSEMSVAGVVVQGRVGGSQWTKSIKAEVQKEDGSRVEVPGVFDTSTSNQNSGSAQVEVNFPESVVGRYVIIKPQSWGNHLSMRCAVLALVSSTLPPADFTTAYMINPAENKRTYSSVWNDDAAGTGFARSMIGSTQAWSSQHNDKDQWVKMDLESEMSVAGLVVQDRYYSSQRVTSIKAEVQKEDGTRVEVPGDFDTSTRSNNGAINNKQVKVQFPEPVVGRYVIIKPQAWQDHISMRCAVLTYPNDQP
jgi:hypothetical protein